MDLKIRIVFCGCLIFSACEKIPTEITPLPASLIKGVTLADWTAKGYSQPSCENVIITIGANGATHLAIVMTGYQTSKTSNRVYHDPNLTPTSNSVSQAVAWAKSAGMKVVLKPQLLAKDAAWPGEINPSDPEEWFDSYTQFLLFWADEARSASVDQFIVGTELGQTIQHQELWQELIEKVRAVYTGELVYAASWDEAHKVPFWDDLDYVGVDFYFPVAERKSPGRFEILAGWQPWLERLAALHKQTGKNILFTEIGYRSIDGAGMNPHQFGNRGEIDLAEQADLYWAALQATADISWMAGMYWWNWLADGSGGSNNHDFTPFDKPAESVLKDFWANSDNAK